MIPYILPILYPDPQALESRPCDLCCGECRNPCGLVPNREEAP